MSSHYGRRSFSIYCPLFIAHDIHNRNTQKLRDRYDNWTLVVVVVYMNDDKMYLYVIRSSSSPIQHIHRCRISYLISVSNYSCSTLQDCFQWLDADMNSHTKYQMEPPGILRRSDIHDKLQENLCKCAWTHQ